MRDDALGTAVFMFDVSHQTVSVERINEKIASHPAVVDWWNYIPGCYLLRLSCQPHELTSYLDEVNGFLLASIDPMTLSGKLSRVAWDQMFKGLMRDQSDELAAAIKARRGSLPFEKK